MDESHKSFVDSLVGERIAGRYLVERVLRSGGMGLVALARYPELEQEVAIKFMRPEYASNPILAARFLREARLAARVKSPHFVRVFDFGRLDSGVPYLVMEMLAGRDLRDELDARGALAIDVAVDYVLQAAVGIAEIHALGVVHRDLKPSNLFLAEAAGAESIKVLDFGVSKEKKAEDGTALTSTGHLVGTPQYMSPEQIKESKTADVRSDIWSLGVILYELLTNDVPFGGSDGTGEEPIGIGEVYGLILHTDPTPLRARAPELPIALEEVVHKCLKRAPGDRYANVGELADALRPFASPASLPRITQVHRALATPHKPISSDEDRGHAPPAPSPRTAPTAESSPHAKRDASDPSPSPARPPTPLEAATTAHETSMTASRTSDIPRVLRVEKPPAAARARALWGGIAGAVVIAVVAVGIASQRASSPSSPPASPPASLVVKEPVPAPAPATPALPAVSAAASSAPPPPVASARVPAPSTAAPTSHAKHHAPSPPPGSSASASPADLLLDRK